MSRYLPLAIALALALPLTARAATDTDEDVFTLGRLTVTGKRLEVVATGDSTITREEMWAFNTLTLDDAVKLTPGVMVSSGIGRRNEYDIFVRGFGRWQVPLSIDGVRIYLPADNRIDFRRFLTADLSEVQVQKGHVSVIDGPGAMGGAINLVTSKPTRPFESHAQLGADFGRSGSRNAWNGYASLGTRQELFYLHASLSIQDREHWQLPGEFTGTSIQPKGARNRSATRDTRVNVKLGFTPNASDEYTLNYTQQDGSKGAPLNVWQDPPNPPNSYWDWPVWDIENIYFLSNTRFGNGHVIKTKLYYNTFDNILNAYDNNTYTTQSNNGRFESNYNDKGYGVSIEYAAPLLPASQARMAVHWRSDRHSEFNFNRPTHPSLSTLEPPQRNREDTWSVALENTWHAGDTMDVRVGASYDHNEVKQAQEYNLVRGLYTYPLGGSHAWNGQAGFTWRTGESTQLAASLSTRTRFATTFERFSTRFGTAIPNPGLGSERSTQLELTWERAFGDEAQISTAVFYADVTDMIQTVVVDAGPPQMTQTRNVGDGEFYGLEVGGQARLAANVILGGNLTWLHRRIKDALQPDYRPTGIPDAQALLYATWAPAPRWSVTPTIETATNRWNSGQGTAYLRTGRHTLANLQMQWDVLDNVSIAFGARNITDKLYELSWGFPEMGRSFYAKAQLNF